MTGFADARAIKQENVLLIGPFPEGRPVEEPGGALAGGFRRCNIALLIAWPGFRTPYPAIARLLHRHRIPFSLILCGAPGPVVSDPDRITTPRGLASFFTLEDPSPCWRCLELRWLGWTDDVPRGLHWLESLQFPELCKPSGLLAPSEEERVMLSWTAMDVLGSDAGRARVVAEDGTFTEHTFLPHPQCAWCSPWSGVKPHPERPDGDIARIFDDQFGLLRLADPRPLPSLLAVPPNGPDPVFVDAVKGSPLHVHRLDVADGTPYYAPSPTTFSAAAVDGVPPELVLDGLAAYAMRMRAGRPTWRGTRHGIPLLAPNPREWIFPLLGAQPGQKPFSDELELDWARGHDLQSGEVLGIPADLVFSGPPHDGLACADAALAVAHPKLVVAVRWALSRVAEDDALMSTWYGGLPPPRIPPSSLPAPYASAIREAERRGIQLEVLDLTTDMGVPVLAVVGRSSAHWFYGCGAGMMPERALRAAWARLGQCRVRNLPDPGRAVDFLFEGPERDFPSMVPGGDTDPIDTWRYLLGVRGMQGLWIDITPPDVAAAGVVVARAWIAGALPRPPADVRLDLDPDYVNESPGGVRLLELPMRIGLSDAPLQPEDLNKLPHPFI